MTDWNKRFIDLAVHFSTWSKDNPKVGCVIVDNNNKVLATGYNGMPSWFNDENLLTIEEDKPHMITHAEINALSCLSSDDYKKSLKMYITKPPCKPCAISILYSLVNIEQIYYLDNSSTHFMNKYKVEESLLLLRSNGIKVSGIKV